MNQGTDLVFSELNVDVEYLRHLQPIGHLNSSYLQVLFDTASFKNLNTGEKVSSQSVKNYIVYLVDGCVEKSQANITQQIKSGDVEPLFADNEIAEVVVKQKSTLLMLDRKLCDIFEKEYHFREMLNMPKTIA